MPDEEALRTWFRPSRELSMLPLRSLCSSYLDLPGVGKKQRNRIQKTQILLLAQIVSSCVTIEHSSRRLDSTSYVHP